MEVSGGADAHLQPGEEPSPEQGDAPEDGHDSMGKPVLEQSVPEGLQPMGGTHSREVCEGLCPVGGTPRWGRGGVRSPPPEEEGAAETTCEELTPTPIPRPPAPPGGGGRENREWGWAGKEGGVGVSWFNPSQQPSTTQPLTHSPPIQWDGGENQEKK